MKNGSNPYAILGWCVDQDMTGVFESEISCANMIDGTSHSGMVGKKAAGTYQVLVVPLGLYLSKVGERIIKNAADMLTSAFRELIAWSHDVGLWLPPKCLPTYRHSFRFLRIP